MFCGKRIKYGASILGSALVTVALGGINLAYGQNAQAAKPYAYLPSASNEAAIAADLSWSVPEVQAGLKFWKDDAEFFRSNVLNRPAPPNAKPPVRDTRDLRGTWQPEFTPFVILPSEGAREDGLAPYRPEADKIFMYALKMNIDGYPLALPAVYCRPTGPQHVTLPISFQMFKDGDTLWQVFETRWNTVRIIHLNEDHPKNLKPSYLGHTVGRWEGNTFVTDTIGFNAKSTRLDYAGSPHSDKLHMVERWTKAEDGSYIDYVVTYDDPVYYTRPFSVKIKYLWRPMAPIGFAPCEDNPRAVIIKGVVYDGVRPAKFKGGKSVPSSEANK